ncbi:DUF5067 domain-containing protein [Jeotgalicoccus huakuii]|nr:DUF5067 domain-containing protein [Jeotgalicoccus huakuii]
MDFKKPFIMGGMALTLALAACGNATDEEQADNEGTEEASEDSLSYSGANGDYTFNNFTVVEVPSTDEEGNETSVPAVVVEFDFENTTDNAVTPSESFSLDLAIRQLSDAGEAPTDNLTMDLEDGSEFDEGKAASSELVDAGESSTAVVVYGPLDPEMDTHLQARENPLEETEELDETLDLDFSTVDSAESEESSEDSEE